jgi:hypothetical protein
MNKKYHIPENVVEIVVNDKGIFAEKLKLIKNKRKWRVVKYLQPLEEIK